MLTGKTLFISCVSAEFGSYRDFLRKELERPNLNIKIQEDFIGGPNTTLDKLDDYILESSAILHLVGDMTGAEAQPPSVDAILDRYPDIGERLPIAEYLKPDGPRLSYTQWEAWLAIYQKRPLLIAKPSAEAPRDDQFVADPGQQEAQQAHLELLKKMEKYSELKDFYCPEILGFRVLASQLADILPPPAIAAATLDRFRELSSKLFEVGRLQWGVPNFVAPLKLEKKGAADQGHQIVDQRDIIALIEGGENIVLFGDGGIGKTTLLLTLANELNDSQASKIILYIDAAAWARSNINLYEYLASSLGAQELGMSVTDLIKVASAGHLSIALNGWNEISVDQKAHCITYIKSTIGSSRKMNFIVTTRSKSDSVSLESNLDIQVRGISWFDQVDIIRSECGEKSEEIIKFLSENNDLRIAARSPLILMGIISKGSSENLGNSCTLDLLKAIIDRYEEEDARRHLLDAAPLHGYHHRYLEAISIFLTSSGETTASKEEMLRVVSAVARELYESGLIGPQYEPANILASLSSNHLLQTDADFYRFAHQRFQEFYSANHLVNILIGGGLDAASLEKYLNEPSWIDSIFIAVEKIGNSPELAEQRSRLVEVANSIDIKLASDVCGVSNFQLSDNEELHNQLVAEIDSLCDSSNAQVKTYGVSCLIATELPYFSEKLVALLQDDDRNTRYDVLRMGRGIVVNQLFGGGEDVSINWPQDRRKGLISELAERQENYSYVIDLARSEEDESVKSSALESLLWNFPASEESIEIWSESAGDALHNDTIISLIVRGFREGYENPKVYRRLVDITEDELSISALISLATLIKAEEFHQNGIDRLVDHITNNEHINHDGHILVFLNERDKNILKQVAIRKFLAGKRKEQWSEKQLIELSIEEKDATFSNAYDLYMAPGRNNISEEILGALFSQGKLETLLNHYLELSQDIRGNEENKEKYYKLRALFKYVDCEALINVALSISEELSYELSLQIIDIFSLLSR